MFGYSLLLAAVLLVGAPYWLFRMATSGRYRAGLASRLGFIPASLRDRVSAVRLERRGNGGQRPLIWIHAVSVGEVLAAIRLIQEIRTGEFNHLRPGSVFAVSTTTETGQQLAKERLPDCAVFYFPLDFGLIVRRYLRLFNPELVVLVESELWPRLIVECSRAGVPVAVVNARISDRSFPRYMALRPLWRPLLDKVSLFLAQSEETASRLGQMGASRIEVSGNIKYDVTPAKETYLVTSFRRKLQPGTQVIVCGSTLAGEEDLILDAWPGILETHPGTILVIAPRHPERFNDVALLLKERGFFTTRATAFSTDRTPLQQDSPFLLDTIGDLASLYQLASVAFVGGSLVPSGGHNPLEPAQAGVPVVIGSSFENFREIVEAMRAVNGIAVVDRKRLASAISSLLEDRSEARALGERGKAVASARKGATARTATGLFGLLPSRQDARALPAAVRESVLTGDQDAGSPQ